MSVDFRSVFIVHPDDFRIKRSVNLPRSAFESFRARKEEHAGRVVAVHDVASSSTFDLVKGEYLFTMSMEQTRYYLEPDIVEWLEKNYEPGVCGC
ncbi:MAG: hypothetical protein A2836_03575 [Candidatus Taylorbacteria bacterium RIFCSPHIGHO2_01_FULL_45_63]|uniref:Uncharacterized protein n=1 Tax=Candidatus Taylorbacteria bacterium RIFCSPHIGHO2_02_FULL_45_35 TaxID=1802311 RepID=A0A1G2MQA6_9BACT|nr:MAG: hypothetical protein A2836_03575 [Candidatus Taylorbacteria bacterium RIFCSPHIGHO2_01_FULL_45_63]OHA26045.1 MAG: hypothetical protein A3D56_02915 [Candidatus Taylorbacteria bacterium RIFCSPHIGHO2_02_FULL_45_35]OHA32474.1 MAG: hypothetical protein A3A22_01580 [Candidatus Taylorbacteria bacterium RIFCSPLOWO2_01_FULL_45_34b]